MQFNVEKLHRELVKAGIPIEGCDDNGRISFSPEATPEQRTASKRILGLHVPVSEREVALAALKARGPATNETMPGLSERVGLIERILGIEAE